VDQLASYWIEKLRLLPHPEGGYFREVYRSDELMTDLFGRYNGPRSISTSIYFLLPGDHFSAFHRIQSDETWHFYSGCGLEVFIFGPDNIYKKIVLGPDGSDSPKFQYTIFRNHWFAAKPLQSDSYSLLGCTVAPGFDFGDFEMGKYNELAATFPQHADLFKKYCLE
jgi:predicted cupin superfamily sugar epimerase